LTEHLLLALGSIIVLGIAAQWLAWRTHLPAILLLLVFGMVAGPVTGFLVPDVVFGDLLFPLVSISVAIILFEGGLSLHRRELPEVGGVVGNLITIAVVVTWILSAAGAYFIVGIELAPAILLGAILVVSGPTVIIPLLRQVKPAGRIGSIVKWEGIVNDPIGAILAVFVFQVIVAGGFKAGTSVAILGIIKAGVFGGLIGVGGAVVMVLLLKRYLVPDFLQNPAALMVVVMCYAASNAIQSESGLLAVTVMGFALANQRFVSIRHIVEFKESLRVLMISSLFIILAARLSFDQLTLLGGTSWVFVGLLILVVRPAAVFLSTIMSPLRWNERLFLSWMAPRGIVAAAVSSVFAIRLVEGGYPKCECLVPLTFQVIMVTVAVYGLTALPVARLLKLAKPHPHGVLFAGAQQWARSMAYMLREEGYQTALVDTNWVNVTEARKAGCRAYYANVLSENLLFDVQLDGIGRLIALTPNDEVNSLAALRFLDIFGRQEVYQLPPATKNSGSRKEAMPLHLHGRFLFSKEANYRYMEARFRGGAIVKKTLITEEFDYGAFREMYGETALPLFIITESDVLRICTADSPAMVQAGQTVISLVDPPNNETGLARTSPIGQAP
jgi:NhaP-type Na+/H+ or K+/H+ antiporter